MERRVAQGRGAWASASQLQTPEEAATMAQLPALLGEAARRGDAAAEATLATFTALDLARAQGTGG